jgi:hypothetical protein
MPVERIREHSWLMEHVVPHLPTVRVLDDERWHLAREHHDVKPRRQIADEVRDFLYGVGEEMELWGYYSSYDHIAMSQLWGRMIDRPSYIPMITLDVQQEAQRLGLTASLPAQPRDLHNALADARWTRDAWAYLTNRTPLYCSECGNTLASHAYTWCPGPRTEGE